MAVTIELEDVSLGPRMAQLAPEQLEKAWASSRGCIESVQDMPTNTVQVFTEKNLLVEAVRLAFYQHYPLVLSPDVIWVTILQGLANHVDQNSEGLRKKFVSFEGKKIIEVFRPEFVKGSRQNDWESCLQDIVSGIRKHVGKETTERLAADFTTTGTAERAVAAVALMDTMQHYFEYQCFMGCGFPSITLTGTPSDWQSVRRKAEELQQYDLGWWLDVLLPVLDQFVAAADGNADKAFWRSLCNMRGASGWIGDPVTGWVQAFYPYLNASGETSFGGRAPRSQTQGRSKSMIRNDGMASYRKSYENQINVANYQATADGVPPRMQDGPPNAKLCDFGTKVDLFPPAISSAPFKYVDISGGSKVIYNMKLMGGVSCIVQDGETLAIEPKLTWAVVDLGLATSGRCACS